MAFSETGGSPTDDPESGATASQVHEDFRKKNLDAKTAFENAFADDVEMRDGINRIVEELEGNAPPKQKGAASEVKPSREDAVTRLKAARKRKEAEALEAKAKADAAAWMHRQVNAKAPQSSPATVPGKCPTESKPCETASKYGPAPRADCGPEEDAASASLQSRQALLENVDRANAAVQPEDLCESSSRSQIQQPGAERLGVMTRLKLPEKPPNVDDGQVMPTCGSLPGKGTIAKKHAEDPEFYRLLDIRVDATFEEIKKAFRRQALQWHPDKNRHQPEKATDRFKRINEAFDTLFDPKKRQAYDSGKVKMHNKAKKLQGHGWSNAADEDDSALTPLGFKIKKQSWNGYIYFGGRWDDVDPLTDYENDPRAPQEKIKVFWRFIGEKAYDARENGYFAAGERASDRCDVGRNWLKLFVEGVWNGTPNRWPGAQELQGMNESSRQEWLERRMIYNRRKQKVLLHLDLHEQYLATPDRVKKEKEVLRKIWKDRIKD